MTTCQLPQTPIAGNHYALIECPDGTINPGVSSGYPIDVTSVGPECLNFYGGTLVTITGTNFPDTLEGNTVTITFTLNNAECSINSISTTTITCTSPAFSPHD